MAIETKCSVDKGNVELETSQQEYLLYQIVVESGTPAYTLIEKAGSKKREVLSDATCPSPCKRKWPLSSDEIPPESPVSHGLGIAMVGPGRLKYKVERYDQQDKLVETVKDCVYTNLTGSDNRFSRLRIHLL